MGADDDLTGLLRDTGVPLERAILGALDDLEHALALEVLGDNNFRAHSEPSRFGRTFGGQLLAQAMTAAAATVDDKLPHSLHAYFVAVGMSDRPLEIVVERIRDGRTMSTRQVRVLQDHRTLLTAMVSFHSDAVGPGLVRSAGPGSAPEMLPLLQHWAQRATPDMSAGARGWIDLPPPLEMRIGEAPTFLIPVHADGPREHWMRLPRQVPDDPVLHRALLAYASDYLLLDMALRAHPHTANYATHTALSLDHTIWLHGTVDFTQWHRYTQETVSIAGHRALVHGAIFDSDGRLVANTAQDVLVRPFRTPSSTTPAEQKR